MANVKLTFLGTEQSNTENQELQCYINYQNDIFISINNGTTSDDLMCQVVCLDKSTAIRLAKTLRTEINKIED